MTVGSHTDDDSTMFDIFSGNNDFLKRMIPAARKDTPPPPRQKTKSKTIDTADEGRR
jgi:hypothetical protein